MWRFLLEIASIIFVPWLISRVISFIKSRRSPPPPPASVSAVDAAAAKEDHHHGHDHNHDIAVDHTKVNGSRGSKWINRIMCLVYLSSASYFAYNAMRVYPDDFFYLIKTDYDAPNFLVRNNFRDYVATRRAVDDLFERPNPTVRLPPGGRKLFQRHQRQQQYQDDYYGSEGGSSSNSDDELYSEYDYYFAVFELMKVKVNRQVYATFGDRAYTECDWCQEYMDYYYYSIGPVLLPYAIACLLLTAVPGVGNAFVGWTSYLIMSVAISDELSRLPKDYLKDAGIVIPLVPFDRAFFVARNLMFACILVILFLHRATGMASAGGNDAGGDAKAVVMKEAMDILKRIQTIGLQSEAVMEDKELYEKFVTYHRKRTGSILNGSQVAAAGDNGCSSSSGGEQLMQKESIQNVAKETSVAYQRSSKTEKI
jgi:hypothetical protein